MVLTILLIHGGIMFIKSLRTICAIFLSGILVFSLPAYASHVSIASQFNKQDQKIAPHYLKKLQKQLQTKRLAYKTKDYYEVLLEQIADNTISSVFLDEAFTKEQVITLLGALQDNTSVEYLDLVAGLYLQAGKSDQEVVSLLAELLSKNTRIMGFGLYNQSDFVTEVLEIDAPSLEVILNGIQAAQSIESINFIGWSFTPETAQSLTNFVANQNFLESFVLGLDNGKGGVCDATCAGNALPFFQAIQKSTIRGFVTWTNVGTSADQGSEIAKALSETVLQKPDLKLFGLYDFKIDSDTAAQFSNGFANVDSLYSLYLQDNGLTDEAFAKMLPGLSNITSLHNLDIVLQDFSSNNSASGLVNLYRNNPLEYLSFLQVFSPEFVLDAGNVQHFAAKLAEDVTLESLALELGIEDQGAYLLAEALEQNTVLDTVGLYGNHFTTKGTRALMSVLEDNYTILSYQLDFWGMDLNDEEINLFFDRLLRNWEMHTDPRA